MDLQTDRKVALKVLRWQGDAAEARFAREASVLSDLQHPAIVRYVAHGRTPEGDAYLAMEWIEGELLSERLKRSLLSVVESIALVTRVAEALAVAHGRRIVHRDLKPSNLLCEGGDVARVKVLDFGLARNDASSLLVLTRTGELAGTPGYMAPEQARGLHEVDARADVYSLGCVLYECLAGRRAFAGEHIYAVLAKILVEEPPRVSELRPEVPLALDDLVVRMMAKNPHDRPTDAADVLAELQRVGEAGLHAAPPQPDRGLGRAEQRVLCVILAAGEHQEVDEETAKTVSEKEQQQSNLALAAAVKAYGGAMERLAGGYVVVTLGGAGSATDLAARAARCALAIAAFLPDKQVAVATGRGLAHERVPVGAAIDQAASLIARASSEPVGSSSAPSQQRSAVASTAPAPWMPVRVDEITAGLLDPRFELGVADGGILLLGFAEYRDADRTLLGKPTHFVGRERELANLLGILEECRAEPLAQAVLVTGPAGAGKTRLRAELLRRAREDDPHLQVWIGRGDPMAVGAPLSLLAQMIRREAGILHGESPRNGRRKLRARVGRHVAAGELDRVTEFLGEICGVPFRDERHPELRAARGDAAMMGDQMRRAWEDLLDAECAAGPVVLVLENLQWGDLPTVKFIDAALRSLSRRPLMVLALGRPEVHDLFPDLWANRVMQVLTLRPLTERAARKLIAETLGPDVLDDVVKRIIDEAAGNAFYLEELIRAAALGQDSPGTVLAMIGARIEALPGEHRRLLRAASVMGESFWPGVLRSLIGRDDAWIARTLAELVEQEWLVQRNDSVHVDETECSFRHALVREAAYAMLTEEDRALGHRLAARWLEDIGESDAMTVGEHYERGGEPASATSWYLRAAKQALGGTDLAAAIARARRGLACADSGRGGDEELGQLRAVMAEAYNWSGDDAEAEADGVTAMELLPLGSPAWFTAAAQVVLAAGRLGHQDRVVSLADELDRLHVDEEHAAPWFRAAVLAVEKLIFAGLRHDLAESLIRRMEVVLGVAQNHDPSAPARLQVVHGFRAAVNGDLGACLTWLSEAAVIYERVGDVRRACVTRHEIGYVCLELGAWARGEDELRRALRDAEQLGMNRLESTARQNLGLALAHRGAYAEAEQLERASRAQFAARGDLRLEAGSHQYLAIVLMLAGDLETAEVEARQVVELDPGPTPTRAISLGVLADVLMRRGRAGEALAYAREAAAILHDLGGIVESDSRIRLVLAQALHATGDIAGARDAIAAARDRLTEVAARISDAELRQSFLEQVPEHACTLDLARSWLEAEP